jgi:tetratricopeptide (TPR) repeat protein
MKSPGLGLARVWLVAILACVLSSSLQTQILNTGNIIGRVRLDRGGFPPGRVEVILQLHGATVTSTYTDNEGNFAFYDLPGNLYNITIRGEGYRTTDLAVAMRPEVQRSQYLSVSLASLPPESSTTSETSLAGSNPGMVDTAAMMQSFPKEARKEFDKGSKMQKEGKADKAIKHYEKALGIAPTLYFARNNLGSLYLEKQDYGAAEAEFRKVIEINQADAAAYFNLGNLCLLTKRYEAAFGWLQEGMKREPNSALGHFLLGSAYTAMGSANEAEKSLQSALRLDPTLANVRLALVNLYLAQSRKQDAIQELQQFLKKSPDSPLAPQAERVLKQLRNN